MSLISRSSILACKTVEDASIQYINACHYGSESEPLRVSNLRSFLEEEEDEREEELELDMEDMYFEMLDSLEYY